MACVPDDSSTVHGSIHIAPGAGFDEQEAGEASVSFEEGVLSGLVLCRSVCQQVLHCCRKRMACDYDPSLHETSNKCIEKRSEYFERNLLFIPQISRGADPISKPQLASS